MADQRQSRKNDYEEIPGQVIMMKTLPSFHYSLDDDGTAVTIPGSRGFVPPPILLQRSPPSYGETSTSREVANLDGHVQSEDQGVRPKSSLLPVAGLSSEEGYKSQLSSSAFDEFIIEGYEHVTYETSQCIFFNRLSDLITNYFRF